MLQNLQESHRSQIFLSETAPDIAAKLLDEGGLVKEQDFLFSESLKDALADGEPSDRVRYPEREYVVQYDETDLAFMHRWLEHEGIFYWFDNQGPWEESLKFGDNNGSFEPLAIVNRFPYRPGASGAAGQPGARREQGRRGRRGAREQQGQHIPP